MAANCENWGLMIKRLLPKEERPKEPNPLLDRLKRYINDMAQCYGWKFAEMSIVGNDVHLAYGKYNERGLFYATFDVDVLKDETYEKLRNMERKLVALEEA